MRRVKPWYFDVWFGGLDWKSCSQRWTWRIYNPHDLAFPMSSTYLNEKTWPPSFPENIFLQRRPHHSVSIPVCRCSPVRLLIHIEANFHGFRRKVHIANFFTSFIASGGQSPMQSLCRMSSGFFSHENWIPNTMKSQKKVKKVHTSWNHPHKGKAESLCFIEWKRIGHYCTLQYVIHPHFISTFQSTHEITWIWCIYI